MSVEAGHLAPEGWVGLVGCCGCQGGSFGLQPGPTERGSQLPWCPRVGFYLEGMAPWSFGGAGVDGPGLPFLSAPVPDEVVDGLVAVSNVAPWLRWTVVAYPRANRSKPI